jgi:hypothetical protein
MYAQQYNAPHVMQPWSMQMTFSTQERSPQQHHHHSAALNSGDWPSEHDALLPSSASPCLWLTIRHAPENYVKAS